MKPIILASSSPRRKKILEDLSVPFFIIKPPFEEIAPASMDYELIPEYFAKQKALSVLPLIDKNSTDFILGLDTIVVHNDIVYGKPTDIFEAKSTLKALSGTEHSVITGIAAYNINTKEVITRTSKSRIKICELTENDINWYLEKNEWQDAAGAYKVQGYFQRFIYHIEGSFSSIMGLPIFDFYDIMLMQGYVFT